MANLRPRLSVDDIATRFWEDYLRLSPTTATMYGDDRYDDRLDDPGPEGRAAARALAVRTLDEASRVPEEDLDTEGRITRDMLRVVAQLAIEDDELAFHELRAVDQISGPQTLLTQLVQFQPADTPERLEAFVARLHAYGPFMASYIRIVDEARASGRTAPRVAAERTIEQLRRLLAIPLDEALIPTMARVASEEDRERIRQVVAEVVYPADQAFLAALEGPYLAATREEPGLRSAPDGDRLYRHAIRTWTTLDLEPGEVHRIGLEELGQLDEERRRISRAAGFGDDVAAFRAHLGALASNRPTTTEDLVARATEDIGRALDAAPRMFGRLPRARCGVKRVEAFKERDAPFAYYFSPSLDGSRDGTYYVNTYDLASRTFSKLASTTYHEAVPGHHFQISLEMEHPSLNVFRRLGSRMVGSAYAEGWGLYAERLADELGLYRDEGERFGMLDAQAWRAARLVVDTGVHVLGWSRDRSVRFLLETGLSRTDAEIETDRYVVWPGQALTYMVGLREIRRLRRDLEASLGAAFDLRSFHDQLLGHGSLPLATLARELPRWVTGLV